MLFIRLLLLWSTRYNNFKEGIVSKANWIKQVNEIELTCSVQHIQTNIERKYAIELRS